MAAAARSRPSSILLLPDVVVSSASSVSSKTSHRKEAPKRIRFAPLPEPNRDEHQDNILFVADTTQISKHAAEACDPDPPPQLNEDLVISSSSSSSSSQFSSSTTSTPLIPNLDKSSPDSSVGSSPIVQLSTLPSKYPVTNPVASSATNNTATNDNSPPQSLSWVKKPHISLLRPFKRFSNSSSGSSSHTLTPTPSIETHAPRKSISTEEILTLGVVNLFRTTSRESARSTRSARDNNSSSTIGWGLGLSRWTSIGNSSTNLIGSSPLARTQSTQSYKSKSSSLFPTFPSSSSSSSLSSDSKTKVKTGQAPLVHQHPRTSRYKGTRMLNGRVYGGPKKKNENTNPFANARDEEPEFVEWGYGGMGSVKGVKSAGVSSHWERLQGGSAMGYGDKTRIDVDDNGDDGSGLAWVKKRREERERKAREQKEKEAEKENSESQMNTPVPTRSSTLETIVPVVGVPTLSLPPPVVETTTHTPLAIDVSPLTMVLENKDEDNEEIDTTANIPTPVPKRYPSELGVSPLSSLPKLSSSLTDSINANQSKTEEDQFHSNATTHENERVLQAITVPVRVPRHHHRQFSKGGSKEVLICSSTEGPTAPAPTQVVGSILVSPGSGDTTDAPTDPFHSSTINPIETDKPIFSSSSSSSCSESGSESEVDDGGFDDDDSDDEEDEEDEESQKQNGRRKTALGTAAGVEKISRHKD